MTTSSNTSPEASRNRAASNGSASPMKSSWWREPIVLFAVVAAGIFVLDAFSGAESEVETAPAATVAAMQALDTIVIDSALVEALEEEFAWLEGVEPTPELTELLVQEWLDDELVFRHALREGMHLSDAKMREHLIEKVRLLWAGSAEPADDQKLLDYYLNNMERYYAEPRVSFVQAFYETMPEDPEGILATLNSGGQVQDDGYWMGAVMDGYAESIIRTSFGGAFYLSLQEAPLDSWIGPLPGPRGVHFVKVTKRTPSRPLAFADIHERVERDYEDQQLLDRVIARTAQLRDSFTIRREDRAQGGE